MKNKYIRLLLAAITPVMLTACDEPLDQACADATLTLSLDWQRQQPPAAIDSGTYTLREINTGMVSSCDASRRSIDIAPGLYSISLQAAASMPDGRRVDVTAVCGSVTVVSGDNSVTLRAFYSHETDDFVIAEVFFAGTLQPSGNQYYGDDYIKIYNNTDRVLYADGLTLFESKFTTTEKFDYTPDIMAEAMTVHALYTIPGSGTDHPVQPGEYLLIADTGIDHRSINSNSFDLSGADFEWHDVSTNPAHTDIDAPGVPNLDKWYCYTLSFWMLHNRGFRAYGIARIPEAKDVYLRDYRYTYNYTMVLPAGTFPMSQTAYRLPNEWIVDVVNCSVQSLYKWCVADPSLDMGWTHCGTIDHDKTRYFHSVRRKLAGFNPAGRPVLIDTNNSSVDFNSMCTPSEIELQGTATNAAGTPCTSLTYDGVTPKERQ